jgi:hypothetical protein
MSIQVLEELMGKKWLTHCPWKKLPISKVSISYKFIKNGKKAN